MRMENNIWIWILVADACALGGGDTQTWDGFSAHPGSLLGGPASPLFPCPASHSPCAGAACLGITVYETDFLL